MGLWGHTTRGISQLWGPSLRLISLKRVPDLVQWTEQCEQSFCQINVLLCRGLLLHLPDFSILFVLQIDILEGWDLFWLRWWRRRSTHCCKLLQILLQESKCSPVEDCLGIKWMFLTFRYSVLGCLFTVWFDQALLQWLHLMKHNLLIQHGFTLFQYGVNVLPRPLRGKIHCWEFTPLNFVIHEKQKHSPHCWWD